MTYKNLTAIVVTFLRDEYLQTCIESLRQQYPDINILVGDNGYSSDKKRELCASVQAEYIELPFDCGLCVARNRLVELVKTPFVLVGDDDFKYTGAAMVGEMLQFMEKNRDFDLIGGRINEGGKVRDYQATFQLDEGHFKINRLKTENYLTSDGLRYTPCDLTFNFFVAKTDVVKATPWDEKIKVAYEHSTFFIDLKRGGRKVAFTPDAIVIHKPEEVVIKDERRKEDYKMYRFRQEDKARFFERFNLRAVTDIRGRIDTMNGLSKSTAGSHKIDVIIKTFERPQCLERLVLSIAKHYPTAHIIIGDDSKRFDVGFYKNLYDKAFAAGLIVKPIAYNLGYDKGLSYGRNELVRRSDADYILLLDDDFVFTEQTNIELFEHVLNSDPSVGVVGGMLLDSTSGKELHFEGIFEKKGKTLRHKADGDKWQGDVVQYKYTGFVLNFALFRRRLFNEVMWDEAIKIQGEHTDFYLRLAQTAWRVAYTPDVKALHQQEVTGEYKDFRARKDFLKILFKKHGLEKIVYQSGFCYEYYPEDDAIIQKRSR